MFQIIGEANSFKIHGNQKIHQKVTGGKRDIEENEGMGC